MRLDRVPPPVLSDDLISPPPGGSIGPLRDTEWKSTAEMIIEVE